jgi:D-beta-D-heptose 7-phosphate kinase/D-beta-D-heptose 1-phosphate adenosyltransferase
MSSITDLKNRKIWVNGTFDIVHIGHIKLLQYARFFGTVRVGLDSDERVRSKKGKSRPYNTLADRMDLISSICFVDSVVSFDSDSELVSRIKEYEPSIMVIGTDYQSKPIIGAEYVDQIVFFNKLAKHSTTAILEYEKNISNR